MNRVNGTLAVVALAAGALLYAHRTGIHQFIVYAALAAGLAGLCLLAAGVCIAAGRERKLRQVRSRLPASQPAVIRRPAAKPGDPCAEACGRPATRTFERWPVCAECGGRLDHAASQPAGRPDHPLKTAGPAASAHGRRPDDDAPALAQPPVMLPPGETVGQFDMTAFEEAHRND